MSDNQETFKHMQVSDLHDVLNNKTHVVVDIRDETSFANGRIMGAIHLSNENLANFLRDTDPDAPVVVCCYHGHASQQAAQFLISQDFTQVYSLDGGFTQWQLQYPEQVSC